MGSFKIYLLTKLLRNKKFFILIIAIFIVVFCLPHVSSFAYFDCDPNNLFLKIQQNISLNYKTQPKIIKIYVTAYSSAPEQTDETPCIAASGYDLCKHDKENVVACNFLPLGSKIKFPELNPDRVYTVVDRMHERFNSRMDIWKRSKQEAKNFGLKYLTVEIYK